MPRTPMAMLSPADQVRLRALRRMKAVALGALIFMAVVFVVASFIWSLCWSRLIDSPLESLSPLPGVR